MPAGITYGGNTNSNGAENLVALVEYLGQMEHSSPTYPEWAKFDTTTMSDNNGGVIKF